MESPTQHRKILSASKLRGMICCAALLLCLVSPLESQEPISTAVAAKETPQRKVSGQEITGQDLSVRWESTQRSSVIVGWQPESEAIGSCLENGLSYVVRYEFELCELQLLWSDICTARRIDKRISQNPISSEITLVVDTLWDEFPPTEAAVGTLRLGLEELDKERFSVELERGARKGHVLKARVSAVCRGTERGFFDRLPALLSLGLLSVGSQPQGSFDSGWKEFSLKE